MIYLLRHGETLFNRDGRYQGQSDSALTGNGRAQARAVGLLLHGLLGAGPQPRLWVSPLGRAQETARIVAACFLPPLQPRTETGLMEVGMGAWDGLTRAEIALRWPEARRGRPRRQWIFHGPGGEGLEAVTARMAAVLDAARRVDAPVILLSHAMSGRVLRALHAGRPVEDVLPEDAPQDAVFALEPGGTIRRVPALPAEG